MVRFGAICRHLDLQVAEDGADRPELLADLVHTAAGGFERAFGLRRERAGGEVEVAPERRAQEQVAHHAADQEQLGARLNLGKLVGDLAAEALDVGRQSRHADR